MSHQLPGNYFSVSERLSHIMDSVGYARKDRERKVTFAIDIEVFHNVDSYFTGNRRYYVFGSRSEGSTGPDLQSDIDYLFLRNTIKVVTDLSQCNPEMDNLLMVKDNHTHPGYVILQHIIISPDSTPVPVCGEKNNKNNITIDSLNRTVATNAMYTELGNVSGPAFHIHNGHKELSIDTVYAMLCTEWPKEENEWFLRRRIHGWPTPVHIENARKCGCFVTPVGHPHSSECHIEWRLSFSIAERELTRSFEDTTMKVYILLKMIRKTYIKPFVGDAFSSYHCKVCMLWMRERIPGHMWINQNLLQCLILCIRQLHEWATAFFCPDYFIITNNIYDRKIIGPIRNTLVQILGNLLSSNCTFLHGIQCCNLGYHLKYQTSRFDDCTKMVDDETFIHILTLQVAYDCRVYIFKYIPQHYSTLLDDLDRLMCATKCLPYIRQYPLRHAMMILFSQLGFHIATICKENAHILSREQVCYLVSLASGCLSLGINSDATSVRLKLCGLGMDLGNHNLIETSLQHISDSHMRYMYSKTFNVSVILACNYASHKEKLLSNEYNIEELLKTQTSYSVIYLPTEMSITPKPLRMEMFRSIGAPSELRHKHFDSWFEWCVVDSLICLYFFQYLNFSRQRKERHTQMAMDNMIHVIRTEPGIPHRDTAFNLLGYSFMQENQLTNAFRCFVQSLNIRPHHNAAKFYLGIIFNRIVFNKIHDNDRGHKL
ncbi:hypothetical protein ACJMK2_018725 [Sinanodonta woodiana]|uniref:Uncharacterized protein n=1 Tax=Sinanodonta woodiana TaxID=1069815 RepID=A0ABD3UEA5_SINWO